MAKEYRRTCKACGKVWHSLVAREKQIKEGQCCDLCSMCFSYSDDAAQAQIKGNAQQSSSELHRLQKCPECSSSNYDEEIV